ncbi:hypothetical protein GCM10008960_41930 [Deinococcus sedimenti]|uniref:Transposase n=1 Tax=Deinococcus sedimenti TaxID=1867090 RepID=A0ABQ2SCW8_9DEIO|nr:hypothetical protein GCM10008960_41930 [Deinococcus sedimenti]
MTALVDTTIQGATEMESRHAETHSGFQFHPTANTTPFNSTSNRWCQVLALLVQES